MSKFNWLEAAEAGLVLVNSPARKIACFANECGEVAMVIHEDGKQVVTAMSVEECLFMVAMLRDAIDTAAPIARRHSVELAAFNAIEDAREGRAR